MSRCNTREYVVSGSRTFAPGATVLLGGHTSDLGETILADPPPGSRGSAAYSTVPLRVVYGSDVPPVVEPACPLPITGKTYLALGKTATHMFAIDYADNVRVGVNAQKAFTGSGINGSFTSFAFARLMAGGKVMFASRPEFLASDRIVTWTLGGAVFVPSASPAVPTTPTGVVTGVGAFFARSETGNTQWATYLFAPDAESVEVARVTQSATCGTGYSGYPIFSDGTVFEQRSSACAAPHTLTFRDRMTAQHIDWSPSAEIQNPPTTQTRGSHAGVYALRAVAPASDAAVRCITTVQRNGTETRLTPVSWGVSAFTDIVEAPNGDIVAKATKAGDQFLVRFSWPDLTVPIPEDCPFSSYALLLSTDVSLGAVPTALLPLD